MLNMERSDPEWNEKDPRFSIIKVLYLIRLSPNNSKKIEMKIINRFYHDSLSIVEVKTYVCGPGWRVLLYIRLVSILKEPVLTTRTPLLSSKERIELIPSNLILWVSVERSSKSCDFLCKEEEKIIFELLIVRVEDLYLPVESS